MFLRALLAFITLPGIAAVLGPPVIAWIDPWRGNFHPLALAVMALGVLILLWCVRDFYVSGKGTLAPWDPPRELVVVGLYRHMRNPMYVGVLVLVLGWGLYFCSWLLFAYVIALAVGFHIRVVRNEEPWLENTFGQEWETYHQGVPRWWPRLTPWEKED